MSSCGNGVSTALAISNAITNLCATLFGQLRRLEPLPPKKKAMWSREMDWLLCVSDHIVELIPSWQTFPDGTKLEVDQGILAQEVDGSSSFRRSLQRQEEKWWMPVPRVLPTGLTKNSRKHLQHKRDCTNQILKAVMAINSATLADMEVPESYMDSLPKNARASLGDLIYRYITSYQFSPECLLACLDLTSEHQAIELANRVDAAIYLWCKRTNVKPTNSTALNFREWTKMHSFDFQGSPSVLGMKEDGDLLMVRSHHANMRELLWYKPENRVMKRTGVQVIHCSKHVLSAKVVPKPCL